MTWRPNVLGSLLLVLLAACAGKPPAVAETGASPQWRLQDQAMVSAADRRAVEAGLQALQEGGSAVDAAIAAHAVLGLVEPQSSGLGGGGFMVVHDRQNGRTISFDGRETAPASATADYFKVDGQELGFGQAVLSGRSVGVPGAIALYKAAHDRYGRLPWAKNFEAAIRLAEEGFIVSPRLANSLNSPRLQNGPLGRNPDSGAYFFPNGKALAVGDRRTNPEYAATLRRVAQEGPGAFYSGTIAADVVAAVRGGEIGGELTLQDLADYRVLERPALCGPFRVYRICSAPPAASGGVAMNLIMSLYAQKQPAPGATSDERLRDFVLAQQLGYADRDHYVADPEQVKVPVAELLDPRYVKARAASGFKPGDPPHPGDPGAVVHGTPFIDMWGRAADAGRPGTSHMSIIDFEGNAVSFTATVEGAFGSSRWTHGFVLNNQLTDFSRPPVVGGRPVANAPGPGKRPRSSMSPTIVFDGKGDVFMVTGSPGGNSIVGYVAKTLVAVLDWGMSAQQASDLPNIVARGPVVSVETASEAGRQWSAALSRQGFQVREVSGEISGLNLIVAREKTLEGAADRRREGVALPLNR